MTRASVPDSLGDRLRADLTGREPDRIAAALREARGLLPGKRVDLPPVGPELLDAFPDPPPWEVVRDFVWLVAHYPSFTPPMTPANRVRIWVATVLRTGDTAAALQVAQYLRGMRQPEADIKAAFGMIAEHLRATARPLDESTRDVADEVARAGAASLVGYLLEQDESYERAADALGTWTAHPQTAQLMRDLEPLLRPQDRRRYGIG